MSGYLGFIRRNWALLGFGFTTVFWGNFGQSFFVAWFGADIQRSLGLSASAYGSAYSLATLGAAIAVIWAGGLIDQVPLRRYVLLVASGLVCALLLLSQASGLGLLMAGFFMLRLFGQSLLPHTGNTTMTRYFYDGRGKAVSVAMSGVPVGEIVLPLIAVGAISWIGWQMSFFWLGLLTAVVLMPLSVWLLSKVDMARFSQPEPGASRQPGISHSPAGRRDVLKDYRYWLALPGVLANPFLVTGIFIHQNFLASGKGWSLGWLASCFVIYGAVHWVSSLVTGALVDRYRAVRLLPLLLIPMLFCMAVIAFVPGQWAAVLMMALLGISAGSTPPVTGSLWPEIYGTSKLGSIRAMNLSMVVLSTSVSPVLFGYFIDAGITVTGLYGACTAYVGLALVMMMASYPANPRPLGS